MSTENELVPQQDAPAVAPESAPEVTETQTEETQEQVQETTQQAEENPEEQGSAPSKAVRELIEQRKKRQRAEQEAAYWRGQAEARIVKEEPKAPQVPVQQQAPQAPSLEDFDTFEAYEKAKDEYVIQAAEHRIAQKILQQQQVAQQERSVKTFEQRMAEAAKDDPSIEEIRNDPTLPVSKTMAQFLHRSELAPQLLKYLNNNRDQSAKIAQMDPISAAMEFGRIEATITATPKTQPKKVSAAPAPIKTVQTSTPASIDEDDLPMEEYYKRRTKQLYGR